MPHDCYLQGWREYALTEVGHSYSTGVICSVMSASVSASGLLLGLEEGSLFTLAI